MDPQIEVHDDIDIYEELDNSEYDLGNKIEKCQKENEELQKHIESQEANLKKLKDALEVVQDEKESLEKNMSSLLITAKYELKRKDTIIADLQRQLDNITFRRISNFRNRNINVDKNGGNNVNNNINTENVDSKPVFDDNNHNRNIFSDRQGPAINNKRNVTKTNPTINENYGNHSKEYNTTEHIDHYENLKNTNSRSRSRTRTVETSTNDKRHSNSMDYIESKHKMVNEHNSRDKKPLSRSKDRSKRMIEISTDNKIDTSSKDYIENKHYEYERKYNKSRKESVNYTDQTEKYNSNYTENTCKHTRSRSKSKERARRPETTTNDRLDTNSKDFEFKNLRENEEYTNQTEKYSITYSDCFDKVFEDIKLRSKSRDSLRSVKTSSNDEIDTNSKEYIKSKVQIENRQKYDEFKRDKSRNRGEYERSHNRSREHKEDINGNSHVERDKGREKNDREYRYNSSRTNKFVGDLRDHIKRRKSRDRTEDEQMFEERKLEGGHQRDVSPVFYAIRKDHEDTGRIEENLEPKPKKISVKDYLQKQNLLRSFAPPIELLPKEKLLNENAIEDAIPEPKEGTNITNNTLENISSDESFSHMDEIDICELKKKIINELFQEQKSKNIPEEKEEKTRKSPRNELKNCEFKNDTQKADMLKSRNEIEHEQKTSKNSSRQNRNSNGKKEKSSVNNVQDSKSNISRTNNIFKETCREHKGDNSTKQSIEDESDLKSSFKRTSSVTKSAKKPAKSPQKSFSPLENVYTLQDEHEKANYQSRRIKCSQNIQAAPLAPSHKSSERLPEPEKTTLSTNSRDQQQANLKNTETISPSGNVANILKPKSQLVIEKNDCKSKSSKDNLDEASVGNTSNLTSQKVSPVVHNSPQKNNKRKRKSGSPIENKITKKKAEETNIELTSISSLENESNQLVEPSTTNVEANNTNIIILSDVTIHSERPNMQDNCNEVENDLISPQTKSTTKGQEESNASEMQDTVKSINNSIPEETQNQRSSLDLSSNSPNKKIEKDKVKNLEEEINKIREKQSLEINNPPKKRKVEFDLNDQKQRQIEGIEQTLKLMHDVEEKKQTPVKRKYNKRIKTETITVRRKSLRQMKNSTPDKVLATPGDSVSDADLKPSESEKSSTNTTEKSATDLPPQSKTNDKPSEKPIANSNTNSYVSPTSDRLLKTCKRITPTPVKDAPVCSFKNILDKNKTGFKIFSKNLVMESTLNLTDEGDIPLLHIEENHFNTMEDATQKTFDRSIMNLLDTMNVSNLECNMSKLNESVDNKEVSPKVVEETALTKTAISTPINRQEKIVSPNKISNSSIQNSSKTSLNNSTSVRRGCRRICRIIAVKKS